MKKIIPAASFLLFSLPALADEAAAVMPPPEDVSPMAMIIVIGLMVAMVAGFIAFTVLKDRKPKDK